MRLRKALLAAVTLLGIASASGAAQDLGPLGGETTRDVSGVDAFTYPVANLQRQHQPPPPHRNLMGLGHCSTAYPVPDAIRMTAGASRQKMAAGQWTRCCFASRPTHTASS
jgi:hypothetical protein